MADPLSETQDLQAISEPGRERIVRQALEGRVKRKKLLPKNSPANIAPSKIAAACGEAMLKRAAGEGISGAAAPGLGEGPVTSGGPEIPGVTHPDPTMMDKIKGWAGAHMPAMSSITGDPAQYGKAWDALRQGHYGEAAGAVPWQGWAGAGAAVGIPALMAYLHSQRRRPEAEEEKYSLAIGAPMAAGPSSVAKVMRNASYGASAGGFKPSCRTDSGNGYTDKKAAEALAYPALCSAKQAGI
jgi:hypothetical protein